MQILNQKLDDVLKYIKNETKSLEGGCLISLKSVQLDVDLEILAQEVTQLGFHCTQKADGTIYVWKSV